MARGTRGAAAPKPKDDMAAKRAKLAGQSFPPSVIPEAGKAINGTFLRMGFGPTKNYGPAPILVFADENGEERSLWLLHTAAKSQVASARPKVGEGFTFTLMGKRESARTGAEYQDCRFVTDSQAEAAEAMASSAVSADDAFDALQAAVDLPWEK